MESMRTSKTGAEFLLGNRLSALRMGRVLLTVAVYPLLRSLLALFPLAALLLLRACRCRSAFVLVTAGFACASWFVLAFPFTRLCCFVFVLGFVLFLLPQGRLVFVAFLRVSRSGSYQKQEHESDTYCSKDFHGFLQLEYELCTTRLSVPANWDDRENAGDASACCN